MRKSNGIEAIKRSGDEVGSAARGKVYIEFKVEEIRIRNIIADRTIEHVIFSKSLDFHFDFESVHSGSAKKRFQ